MVNKRVQNAVLGCNLKNDRMISVRFQGKPFNFTVIHMPQSVTLKKLMLNGSMKTYKMFQNYHPPKRCPFNYRELECKSRKSRNTWSNRQIFPWNEEWSRAKANRVLPKKCINHSKHSLPKTQETLHMDITGWSTPKSDWLYFLQPKMEKLYTVNKNKTRSWLWFRSWTPYFQI